MTKKLILHVLLGAEQDFMHLMPVVFVVVVVFMFLEQVLQYYCNKRCQSTTTSFDKMGEWFNLSDMKISLCSEKRGTKCVMTGNALPLFKNNSAIAYCEDQTRTAVCSRYIYGLAALGINNPISKFKHSLFLYFLF